MAGLVNTECIEIHEKIIQQFAKCEQKNMEVLLLGPWL